MTLERLNDAGPFKAIDFLTPDCSSFTTYEPTAVADTPAHEVNHRCACCGAKIKHRVVVESTSTNKVYFLGKTCATKAREAETRGVKKLERVAFARAELAQFLTKNREAAESLPHPFQSASSLAAYVQWIGENRTEEKQLRSALQRAEGCLNEAAFAVYPAHLTTLSDKELAAEKETVAVELNEWIRPNAERIVRHHERVRLIQEEIESRVTDEDLNAQVEALTSRITEMAVAGVDFAEMKPLLAELKPLEALQEKRDKKGT